jgi:hypothetical protein
MDDPHFDYNPTDAHRRGPAVRWLILSIILAFIVVSFVGLAAKDKRVKELARQAEEAVTSERTLLARRAAELDARERELADFESLTGAGNMVFGAVGIDCQCNDRDTCVVTWPADGEEVGCELLRREVRARKDEWNLEVCRQERGRRHMLEYEQQKGQDGG